LPRDIETLASVTQSDKPIRSTVLASLFRPSKGSIQFRSTMNLSIEHKITKSAKGFYEQNALKK